MRTHKIDDYTIKHNNDVLGIAIHDDWNWGNQYKYSHFVLALINRIEDLEDTHKEVLSCIESGDIDVAINLLGGSDGTAI